MVTLEYYVRCIDVVNPIQQNRTRFFFAKPQLESSYVSIAISNEGSIMLPKLLSSNNDRDDSGSLANEGSSLAHPKLSRNANMELENTDSSDVKLPLHEDIMQLARLGEIGPVRKLFEDGKFDAKYEDRESITPLHVSRKERNRLH